MIACVIMIGEHRGIAKCQDDQLMNDPGTNVVPCIRRMRGFTLVELLITMAVVVIAASVALPSFREFSVNTGTKDNSNQLVGALNVARTEAITRGRPMAVIANGGDWNNGWQVVGSKEIFNGSLVDIEVTPVSPGATASACAGYLDNVVDSSKKVPLCIRHQDALTGGFTIKGKGDPSNTIVIFEPQGNLRDGKPFDFSICRPANQANAARSYRIQVAGSGIIQSRQGTSSAPAGACS